MKQLLNAASLRVVRSDAMHPLISQPAGRNFADLESVLARLLDVMLVAFGAAFAQWVSGQSDFRRRRCGVRGI